MKSITLFFFSIAPLFFYINVLASPTNTMTFNQAIDYALAHNLKLTDAQSVLKVKNLTKKNALSAFLPTLTASSTSIWNSADPATPASGSSNALSLQLNEQLFNSGINFLNYHKAKLSLQLATLTLSQQRNDLLETLINDYLTFSKDTALYRQQRDDLSLLKKQYQSTKAKYHQGMMNEETALALQTQYEQNQFSVNSQQAQINQDQKVLYADLGIPIFDPLRQGLSFVPLTLTHFKHVLPKQAISLKATYDYQLNALTNKVAKLTTKIIDRTIWPSITLSGGPTYARNTAHFLPGSHGSDGTSWQVSLKVSATLFNFGTNWRTLTINAENLKQNLNANTLKLIATQQKLEQFAIKIKSNLQNYQLSQSTKAAGDKNYQLVEKQFQTGQLKYLDLSNALTLKSSANKNYINSLFTLEQSFYQSLSYKGTLYEYLKKQKMAN